MSDYHLNTFSTKTGKCRNLFGIVSKNNQILHKEDLSETHTFGGTQSDVCIFLQAAKHVLWKDTFRNTYDMFSNVFYVRLEGPLSLFGYVQTFIMLYIARNRNKWGIWNQSRQVMHNKNICKAFSEMPYDSLVCGAKQCDA